MRILLLTLTLLTGCGRLDEYYQYDSDCLHFDSQIEFTQSKLDADVGFVKSLLVGKFGINDDKMFCATYSGTYIHVDKERWINCTGTYPCGGMTTPLGEVYLGRHLDGLLHEFLHAWDRDHLAVGSAWHLGWDKNGYDDVDKQYKGRCVDPSDSTPEDIRPPL
jgi:hypothetical protein